MRTTVLLSVQKDDKSWELTQRCEFLHTYMEGAKAVLSLSSNPSGDDPTRITTIDYPDVVHVVHQRGKWVSTSEDSDVVAVWPDDDTNEVHMTIDVKLRVHLYTGVTTEDCHKVAVDVLNGEKNDRIDNIEFLEWEPTTPNSQVGKVKQ
jgi:hypothetical protein